MKHYHIISILFLALNLFVTDLKAAPSPLLLIPESVDTAEYQSKAISRPAAVDPKVYEQTIGNWGYFWWKWLGSFSSANDPNIQSGNVNCTSGQTGKVWFLASAFGGIYQRSCVIPQNTALFIPIFNTIFWTPAPGSTFGCKNEKHCRIVADSVIGDLIDYSCTLDGNSCALHYPIIRAQSDTLRFTIKDGSTFTTFGEIPSTRAISISDGYWLMLAPLKKGKHKLQFTAKTDSYSHDVTYNLTVR
ncbi:MAG: hypothetical protein ACH34X_01195 [Thiolinea sp.]